MTALRSIAAEAAELGNKFGGTLMQPGDAGYEEARRVHNGLINKKPALIAQCRDASDVADAVRLAQRLGLEVAVRGGGHNVAGRATIDGGVMIDLSAMKRIEVDPERRTVRAQGGVTWAELDRETQKHGLAVTGGVVSSTGIAGLTLGGGLGWLMGKYGLALDNLVSLELINAQGELIRASTTDEPDLFWAARGGGGNFGIATTLEYQLHAVGPTITGGLIAYPFDRSRDVLSLFRERTSSLSDEQILFATLAHAPDGSGVKLAAMVTCHCGPLAAGELAMRPLRQLGTPALDGIGPMQYCDLNGMLDAGYPKGAFNYWKSTFLRDLSDDAIRTMIECFARCPTPMGQFVVEHVHGAAVRVGIEETAFPHRQEGYNFLILTQWLDAAMTDRCVAWARDTYARMTPFAAAGRYVNYLGDDEGGDPVPAAYGANYRRLRELKSKYDPKNFFRMNQNIRPSV
ncbi:6-hydroxy-D-nicotine oxidase [Bradyrhizobium ivorense]|uniref:6-hydroxy-D-nicotine oxidase n=1 Tax=Bradyrhizobium ivorense TaxID=2511166 RepID=A0A508TCQ1_9BRAD|nr:FAD-binding oxidoreductase [Bradyrhizobium ivorense]VIO72579.1 6-hydroxy-D-nicotine oxidase [Bradyrhizobium ivorense]